MKTLLWSLCALLALGACTKDYSKLVDEKVKQLQKEGKTVLARSNDPTGAEHYVIYMDETGITLDSLKGEPTVVEYGTKVYENKFVFDEGANELKTVVAPFISRPGIGASLEYDLSTKKLYIKGGSYYSGEDEEVSEKYIECHGKQLLTLGGGYAIFFDKPDKVFNIGSNDIRPQTATIMATTMEKFSYLLESPFLDNAYHFQFLEIVYFMDWDGNVLRADKIGYVGGHGLDYIMFPDLGLSTESLTRDKLNMLAQRIESALGYSEY